MEEKHMAIQTAVIESFRLLPEVNLITFQVSSNLVSLSVYTSADYLERTLLNKLLDVEISLLDTFPDHLFDFCYNFYPPDFTPGQPIIYQS